jgi:TetR/AcrR family transcriptional regulator, ethionamide resistance regulator
VSAVPGSAPIARRKRRGGPAGRQILEATERLLKTLPLSELSVERLCEEAGVSRATYYHYFGSRTAPLATLATELWDQVFTQIQPFVDGAASRTPEQLIRETFKAAWQIWIDHAPVFRALAENWRADPELESLWVTIIGRFTEAIAAEIDRERDTGSAPPGPDSRELASVLLWSTAHCLYIAGTGVDSRMPNEADLFETVIAIWLRSIYGERANGAGEPPGRRSAA